MDTDVRPPCVCVCLYNMRCAQLQFVTSKNTYIHIVYEQPRTTFRHCSRYTCERYARELHFKASICIQKSTNWWFTLARKPPFCLMQHGTVHTRLQSVRQSVSRTTERPTKRHKNSQSSLPLLLQRPILSERAKL